LRQGQIGCPRNEGRAEGRADTKKAGQENTGKKTKQNKIYLISK
jgi:hypothetical protein